MMASTCAASSSSRRSRALTDKLVHQGTPPTHISFIGYSAGGLIARYAAGRLFSEGYFDHVTPLNFVTVATPHLGAWRTPREALPQLLNATLPLALSRTGAQLFLSDTTPWGPPLLCVLAPSGLPFMAALHCFRNFVAMASVRYDRFVSFCSASMQLEDPYPERGFEAAVSLVDPAYPSIVRPRKSGEDIPHTSAAAGLPGSGAASPLRRPLRSAFLLALAAAVAALLSPLLSLAGLGLLLQGWLHSRSAAAADIALRRLYDSCGGGSVVASANATAAAGSKPPQSQHHQELPQARAFPRGERVKRGGGLQQVNAATAAAAVPVVATIATDVGAGVKGSPERLVEEKVEAADDGRPPLYPDYLRRQQFDLFAGLPPSSDKQGVREWLAARLATLPVRRVHVDTCDVLLAHAAIIAWNRLFWHCRDGLHYLTDVCMLWD